MAHQFLSTNFTPAVHRAQETYYGRVCEIRATFTAVARVAD